MNARSNWYNRTVKEINLYTDTLGKDGVKKYKLDLLLRLAARVDDFSSQCGECQLLQQEITRIIQELSLLIQMPDKEGRKSYLKMINNITKHLQKKHKLVTKGYYIGIAMAIGFGISTAIGAALDKAGIGPAVGIVLGLAIGGYLDKKAEKEGRVI